MKRLICILIFLCIIAAGCVSQPQQKVAPIPVPEQQNVFTGVAYELTSETCTVVWEFHEEDGIKELRIQPLVYHGYGDTILEPYLIKSPTIGRFTIRRYSGDGFSGIIKEVILTKVYDDRAEYAKVAW